MQRPYSNVPRPARSRTVFLILFIFAVVFVVVVAGMCSFITRDSGTAADFKEAFRFPEYVPDWLGRTQGTYWNLLWERRGMQLPYLLLRWENCHDPGNRKAGVRLGLAYGHLDVDLGPPRTAVDVDGVQGWLTFLAPQDFARPPTGSEEYEEYRRLTEGWDYDREIYDLLLGSRSNALGPLGGHAIVLQWNKNGIHHLLAASAKEPMTEEILLQIASSMEPAPHPTYAEVEGGDDRFGAGCKDLGY